MGVFDGLQDGQHTGDPELDSMLSGLQKLQHDAAEAANKLATETADAWSRDQLAHVWVNAQGVVIQVEIDEPRFADSSARQVGESMVEAAQAAAAKMQTRADAVHAELWQQASGFGVGDMESVLGAEGYKSFNPVVPVSPPGSRERRSLGIAPDRAPASTDDDDDSGWGFTVADTR